MVNDTVSDFLTKLRNASLANKEEVRAYRSKMIESLAEIFKSSGYIREISKDGNYLVMTLNLDTPLNHIKRLSKPGLRNYVKSNAIPRPHSGLGMVIVSTPKGILTGAQARKQRVGGELICEVW